jgi:endonuclease YncB( thermonuclease family)
VGRVIPFRRKKYRYRSNRWLLAIGVACLAFILIWRAADWIAAYQVTNHMEAAQTIQPRWIHIVDGDTIRIAGQSYRLVGFDTPEAGRLAKCASEQTLAARATARLHQLVSSENLRFQRIPCSCRPGTEGTRRCNYGRLCASLSTNGRDVGEILIGEGLAHRYVCGSTSCPRRAGWC